MLAHLLDVEVEERATLVRVHPRLPREVGELRQGDAVDELQLQSLLGDLEPRPGTRVRLPALDLVRQVADELDQQAVVRPQVGLEELERLVLAEVGCQLREDPLGHPDLGLRAGHDGLPSSIPLGMSRIASRLVASLHENLVKIYRL